MAVELTKERIEASEKRVAAKEMEKHGSFVILDNLEASNLYSKEYNDLLNKYKDSAKGNSPTNVGAFNDRTINEGGGVSSFDTNPEISSDAQIRPDKAIKRDRLNVLGEWSPAVGAYDPLTREIQLTGTNYERTDFDNEIYADIAKGSSLARYVVLLHESTHQRHDEKVGIDNILDTPQDRLRKNRLTETVAAATEYLAVANMYTDLKSKGVTKFYDTQIDPDGNKTCVEVPLEHMLKYCPGLEDVVNRDGFSFENKESQKKVVEASAKYWKEKRQSIYDGQAVGHLSISPNLEQRFDALENSPTPMTYDQAAKAMLKDIYIGGNHALIDLSDCRELLDTMSNEDALKLFAGNNFQAGAFFSEDTLKDLNNYLKNCGITDSEEKADFIKSIYNDTILRNDVDSQAVHDIKEILLKDGGNITYLDGIIEKVDPITKQHTIQQGPDGQVFPLVAETNSAIFGTENPAQDASDRRKIEVLRGTASVEKTTVRKDNQQNADLMTYQLANQKQR